MATLKDYLDRIRCFYNINKYTLRLVVKDVPYDFPYFSNNGLNDNNSKIYFAYDELFSDSRTNSIIEGARAPRFKPSVININDVDYITDIAGHIEKDKFDEFAYNTTSEYFVAVISYNELTVGKSKLNELVRDLYKVQINPDVLREFINILGFPILIMITLSIFSVILLTCTLKSLIISLIIQFIVLFFISRTTVNDCIRFLKGHKYLKEILDYDK